MKTIYRIKGIDMKIICHLDKRSENMYGFISINDACKQLNITSRLIRHYRKIGMFNHITYLYKNKVILSIDQFDILEYAVNRMKRPSLNEVQNEVYEKWFNKNTERVE